MRTLCFCISKQKIEKDEKCDFSGIVYGTKGYLMAEFCFDGEEWHGCRKAAVFEVLGKKYPVPIVKGRCEIPDKALEWKSFSVMVVGERDGYRITTNKVEVVQNE